MIRDLRAYEAFVAIVDNPTLTAAAAALGRSVQAVSRDLGRLEADLGAPLLIRTTRRRRLTPAGEAFHGRIKALLGDLQLAREEVALQASSVAGRLSINAPTLFGPRVLTPLVAEFLRRYTDVSVDLSLTDAFVDPARSGADVTIRIGQSPPSGLVVRRLATVRRATLASPGYLAESGRPRHPSDLRAHRCVVRRGARAGDRWVYRVDGRTLAVPVRGRFETDSVAASIEAMVQGLGIGVAAMWQVRELVGEGRLEVVLADYEPPRLPLQALWAPSRRLPARTRLFVEFLAARLAEEAL